MMVIYVPVKYEFDWTNRFRVRVQKQKCGQTKNGQTNGQMNGRNYTNFERNLAMMVIYVPVKFEFDWTNRFQVRIRKQKCGQTDRWTDKHTKNGQTNRRTYTKIRLATAVITFRNKERNLRLPN